MIAEQTRKLSPTCPAATILRGPLGDDDLRVPCGALIQDHKADKDWKREGDGWHVFSLRETPSVVLTRCCARYELCEIWRAERERVWAENNLLKDGDPEP